MMTRITALFLALLTLVPGNSAAESDSPGEANPNETADVRSAEGNASTDSEQELPGGNEAAASPLKAPPSCPSVLDRLCRSIFGCLGPGPSGNGALPVAAPADAQHPGASVATRLDHNGFTAYKGASVDVGGCLN